MRKLSNPNRRTVLKTLGAAAVGGVAMTGTASAEPPFIPPVWAPTWGSDETDNWELADVSGDVERVETKPYTLIPTTDIGKGGPLGHFFGYDQVVDTPPQNKGAYNVNWHTHNVLYDGGGMHQNRPYNGKEVLTNSYEVVKGVFEFLSSGDGDALVAPELVEVSPNDVEENRTGGDDYLNTITQIEEADENGYANVAEEPRNVPDSDGSGNSLFPTDNGYFVGFTFVCPVRPIVDKGNKSK